jgi:hypothetical protein
MESLYDVEQREIGEKKKLERIANIVGRKDNLPKTTLITQSVSIRKITKPEEVFKELGYIRILKNGWIKKIDSQNRFHANITLDGKDIFIHRDKKTKNGRHKVVANGLREERQRFKDAVNKRKPPTIHFKVEKLSHAEVQEALKRLREENHPIKTFIKKIFYPPTQL